MDAEELATVLEPIVDRHGIGQVLQALSYLVGLKADFIESNWQDYGLAKAWRRIGKRLGNVVAAALDEDL
jgi:hypothetical protein